MDYVECFVFVLTDVSVSKYVLKYEHSLWTSSLDIYDSNMTFCIVEQRYLGKIYT